jgi:hypothetical protein
MHIIHICCNAMKLQDGRNWHRSKHKDNNNTQLIMGEQMKAKWENELTKNLPQLGSRLQQRQNEVKHSWIDSNPHVCVVQFVGPLFKSTIQNNQIKEYLKTNIGLKTKSFSSWLVHLNEFAPFLVVATTTKF